MYCPRFDGYTRRRNQQRGVVVAVDASKIEEGIGMHAESLLTLNLDEIRAAGRLENRQLKFVCDRAGINDDELGVRQKASVYMAGAAVGRLGTRGCRAGQRAAQRGCPAAWSVVVSPAAWRATGCAMATLFPFLSPPPGPST